MPVDSIIFHIRTINENHMMYGSCDMERDRHNFFSFWTIFCPFTQPRQINIKYFHRENFLVKQVKKVMKYHFYCMRCYHLAYTFCV